MHPDDTYSNDIAVLREMVRLAENRRTEALDGLEKVNRYNFALIAFSGSFLSLLVSTQSDILIVRIAGFSLIISIFASLHAIRPKILRGGVLIIENDVETLRKGEALSLNSYLLDISEFTNSAATKISIHAKNKRTWTIFSAAFLVFALSTTYIIYAYASTR